MAKFNFNLRHPGADAATPINLVIRWGNRRLVYPTREVIHPAHWNLDPDKGPVQRGREVKAFPEHPEFNERLDDLWNKAKATFRTFITDNGTEPEEDELRDALDIATGRKEPVKRHNLLGYFAAFNAAASQTDFSPTYYRRLRQTFDLLRDHLHGKDVPFTALDITFMRGFTKYLTTTKGYAPNTVRNFLKTLRMVVNLAREEGQDINPAFYSKKVKMPKEDTPTIYLDTDVLEDLWGMDLTTVPRLERVRDLFLLQCWVGLRFSDLLRLSNKNVDGGLIRIRQEKTNQDVVIPLHPIAAAVLTKYGGYPPTMSNQRFNEYVKELVALVPALQVDMAITRTKGGITTTTNIPKWQLVASHTARRSFASNLYLAGDVPVRTIMAITGHKSEAAFLRYLRLDNQQHAKIMAKSKVFTMPERVLKAV
jgi:integrase